MLTLITNGGNNDTVMMEFLLLALITPLALVVAFSRSSARGLIAGQLLAVALVPLWWLMGLPWVALTQLLLAALASGWLRWRALQRQREGNAR